MGGASVWSEEDVDGRGPLQARFRTHQSQWSTATPRRTQDAETKARGARPPAGKGSILRCRYPRQSKRWRSHRPSLCDSSSHFKISRRLLSKIRRRSLQEGNKRHSYLLRSFLACRRSKAERAQEVRRSWSKSALPEVVSLERRHHASGAFLVRSRPLFAPSFFTRILYFKNNSVPNLVRVTTVAHSY